MAVQFVDPAVSLAKFDQEVAHYRELSAEYERRGWFLVEAAYPVVFVVMASAKLQPPALVTGVLFDYTNYDAEPPSVRLVDPFTREPFLAGQLPTTLNQSHPGEAVQIPGINGAAMQLQRVQPLMQAARPDEVPFLCVTGVREYHDHPGHTGDVWELHRAQGAGRLVRLLELVHRYGIEPIQDYSVQLVPQIAFEFGNPPPA
jgi:hypothetical protein